MRPTTLRRAWLVLGSCAAFLCGCNPPEGVRNYNAPRDPVASSVADGTDKSRMLGVIIPIDGGQSRYIKFSGAIDPVTAVEPKFNDFVASVRFANPTAAPTYTVPAGWVENPPRQFVPKSFTVGPEGTPQVTVSDPISGTLLANVNRWRVEVGLPEVADADLTKSVTEITLGDTKAYLVDLRGPAVPGSGAARMRGMPSK